MHTLTKDELALQVGRQQAVITELTESCAALLTMFQTLEEAYRRNDLTLLAVCSLLKTRGVLTYTELSSERAAAIAYKDQMLSEARDKEESHAQTDADAETGTPE